MNRIRIVQSGWEGFSGALGDVTFTDGVSDEPLTRTLIDRISSLVACEVHDGEGAGEQAGVAKRMIGGVTVPVTMVEPLSRLTPVELAQEHAADMLKTGIAPVKIFYSKMELEEVAAKKGINGLREIAKPWGVKDRNINKLIREILNAQGAYEERRKEIEAEMKAAAAKAESESIAAQRKREAEIDAQARVLTPSIDTTPNAVDESGKSVFIDPNKPKDEDDAPVTATGVVDTSDVGDQKVVKASEDEALEDEANEQPETSQNQA